MALRKHKNTGGGLLYNLVKRNLLQTNCSRSSWYLNSLWNLIDYVRKSDNQLLLRPAKIQQKMHNNELWCVTDQQNEQIEQKKTCTKLFKHAYSRTKSDGCFTLVLVLFLDIQVPQWLNLFRHLYSLYYSFFNSMRFLQNIYIPFC